MTANMRSFPRQRIITGGLTVLVMVQATGCMSWNPVSLPAAVAKAPETKVRLVLQGGGTITADSVGSRADSVVTYQENGIGAVALTNVKEVKLRQSSIGKSAALILGIGFAVLVALGLMAGAAD